ncbi:MAG: S-layer homology domain-containing protein [Candidatus Gracilibacteria bacterium]
MKFSSAFLVTMMIAGLFPVTALAGTFSDVPDTHENRAAVEYLVYTGTLEGYSDGTFGPSNTINRAELMKVLVASQGIEPDETLYHDCFPDVTNEWYAPYVCYAYSEGWVDGYPDGTFLPGNTVNKVEASKMIVNAWGYSDILPDSSDISDYDLFDDTDASAWYAPYVYLVKYWNLDGTSGNFNPSEGMDRGGAAEYMFRIIVMEDFDYGWYEDGDDEIFLSYYGLDYLLVDEEDDSSDDSADDSSDAYEYDDSYVEPEDDTSEYVCLNLTSSSSDQTLEVENCGDSTVNLEGYSLETDETFYEFGSYDLAPWESVEIEYYYSGETIYLRSSNGGIIDSDYNF